MSVASFGEIHRRLSLREVDERVNAHFGVRKASASLLGASSEFQLDEEGKPVEKVSRP
jgi:hypothetical protein